MVSLCYFKELDLHGNADVANPRPVGRTSSVSASVYDESMCTCTCLRSDASKLLFQPGYLKVLKSMAISGQLQLYNIRSVVWRVRRGRGDKGREGGRDGGAEEGGREGGRKEGRGTDGGRERVSLYMPCVVISLLFWPFRLYYDLLFETECVLCLCKCTCDHCIVPPTLLSPPSPPHS